MYFFSCQKEIPKDALVEKVTSARTGTSPLNFHLSYDVKIQRTTSFKNGLNASSEGWKKLESVPETESYSFSLDFQDGTYNMVKDNIVFQSPSVKQNRRRSKIAKQVASNSKIQSFDAKGNLLSSGVGTGIVDLGLTTTTLSPLAATIDTTLLNNLGLRYIVSGNTIRVSKKIEYGDNANEAYNIDKNTGLIKLGFFYSDSDPEQLLVRTSYKHNSSGDLQAMNVTSYEYLNDGDVMRVNEGWAFKNYSLSIL